MQPKVVVIGSSNTDMVIRMAHIPSSGETVMGEQFKTVQGGKGANQAVAAARLGAEVVFVARLGCDTFGQESMNAYRAEGINTDFIVRDDANPSGVALIMVDQEGENIIGVASGANACLSPQDVESAESVIKIADCVLLQLEIPLETVEAAVHVACKYGVRIILNPAPAKPLPIQLLNKVDTLTPNETEAVFLAGVLSSSNIIDVASNLRTKSGVKNLLITMGANGTLISNMDNMRIPAFPVKVIDTTGAGDAFNGGLAVALARGDELPGAVRFANAVAALSTMKFGAQSSLPTADEINDFLKSNKEII